MRDWPRLILCGRSVMQASVPNPKFASLDRTFGANFGFDKDTSKHMILVCFMNAKFVKAPAAKSHELRIQHTRSSEGPAADTCDSLA